MKKLILIIALLVISIPAYALPATSNGGHAACLKKVWLDDLINFIVSKDKDSFQAYIDTKKCVTLKSGLKVTVTESPGMFAGTTGFIFKGTKFWTVREAFEYGR